MHSWFFPWSESLLLARIRSPYPSRIEFQENLNPKESECRNSPADSSVLAADLFSGSSGLKRGPIATLFPFGKLDKLLK